MDEGELILWQDVLDEIAAGRAGNLACPHCSARPLVVSQQAGGVTRIACEQCKKFIEGRFGAS